MDLEGHEIEVIEGGMESFKKTPSCRILLEVHPQYYNKERDFSKTLRSLVDIGFSIKYLNSARVDRPKEIKDKGYKPFKVFKCGRFQRGIYQDVALEDAINFSTKEYKLTDKNIYTKIVRAIMLEKMS